MKRFIKTAALFFIVMSLGIGVVYGVMLYLFNNTYHYEFALSDGAFKENKADFKYVAEYAYSLYEDERAEREDLERLTIRSCAEVPEFTYIYEDDSERERKLTDEKLKKALDCVVDAFPYPGGEFSVYVVVREGEVEFRGYYYSLYYSTDGGRPDTDGKECKLKQVSLFSRWYHCYDKYSI